ncbi:hypothetical protein RSAG8_02330, partial [Rhizoctonia solani AG-8 WAC10335]
MMSHGGEAIVKAEVPKFRQACVREGRAEQKEAATERTTKHTRMSRQRISGIGGKQEGKELPDLPKVTPYTSIPSGTQGGMPSKPLINVTYMSHVRPRFDARLGFRGEGHA